MWFGFIHMPQWSRPVSWKVFVLYPVVSTWWPHAQPVSFYYDDFEWNGWSKSETGILSLRLSLRPLNPTCCWMKRTTSRGIIGLLAFYFLLCSPASQFGLVSLLSIVVLLALFLIILFFPFLSHIVLCNSAFGPRFCANKIISYHILNN